MSPITLVVLGLLGLSMGIPVEESFNPRDFYHPSSSRIVGGSEAPEGSAQYMVALVYGELLKSFTCGGALVSHKCVMTAAHCIDVLVSWIDGQLLSSLRGQIGSNSLSSGYITIRFSGYENHPEWDKHLINNDVGLLHVSEPLLKDTFTSIGVSFKYVGGGESLRVTGWGQLSVWGALPDRLQQLQKDTLSPEDCEEWVRKANAELGPSPSVYGETELCTAHVLGAGHGLCFGDSGSPLVRVHPKRLVVGTVSSLVKPKWFVVGLVSWGFPCANGYPYPDVHARMSGFKKWLRPALARAGVVIEE